MSSSEIMAQAAAAAAHAAAGPHADEAAAPIAGAASAAPEVGEAPASLTARAMHSSAWTMIDYVVAQALRFVGSLILTRLLAPDVFGLMTMINVFFQGLEMFSDIGIGPAVIHNKRGGEREFLNTAFTMQVIRGFALFLVSCIGAWPLAVFYREPSLVYLVPLTGISSVIMGFTSTSMVSLNRQLRLRAITLLNISEQVVRYVAVIAFALWSPTVWALIVGTTIGQLFQTIGSHFLVRGERNRLHWNREDARAMLRFGRWVFVSTAMTFLAMQGDKMLIGRLLGTAPLGVYGIAAQYAFIPIQFLKVLGGRVAFPVLAEIVRERPHELYRHSRRVRLALLGVSFAAALPLIVLGDWIIHFLYEGDFRGAGWMLQILTAGTLAGLINSTYGAVLWALGRTFDAMILLAAQLVWLLGASALGYMLDGERGFIIGVAAVEWLNYPLTAFMLHRQKLWQPELDLPILAASAVTIAATFLYMPAPPP